MCICTTVLKADHKLKPPLQVEYFLNSTHLLNAKLSSTTSSFFKKAMMFEDLQLHKL